MVSLVDHRAICEFVGCWLFPNLSKPNESEVFVLLEDRQLSNDLAGEIKAGKDKQLLLNNANQSPVLLCLLFLFILLLLESFATVFGFL